MHVKFDFERIHKDVSWATFRSELKAFCDDVITKAYHGPIMDAVDGLYKDKAFVVLVHKWAEYDKLANEAESETWKELYRDDRDSLAWIIADML